jgi:tRNA (guanine10-N2)-methyltransferase
MVELLCWFAQKHVEFRVPEAAALAELGGFELDMASNPELASPFLLTRFPSQAAAAALASRAVLMRGVLEVWGQGTSYEECVAAAEAYPVASKDALRASGCKIHVDGFGRKFKKEEQRERVARFAGVGLGGADVAGSGAEVEVFWVIEDYGADASGMPMVQGERPRTPQRIFFARQVCEGGRAAVETYNLKKRAYLGPTSMDAELALLSANMALARPGALALDPFAGTGSIMIACAHFGATSWGAEIHAPVLRGKQAGRDVRANYTQYGLPMPQLVVADFTRPPWAVAHGAAACHVGGLFDMIVCDPPYGIREGARRLAAPAQPLHTGAVAVAPEGTAGVGPEAPAGMAKVRLGVVDQMDELLSFAAAALVVGGRLVYWLPTTTDYLPQDVPMHPCLREHANSCQQLSTTLCRRLITMVKTRDPVAGDRCAGEPPLEQPGQRVPAHHNLSARVFKQSARAEDTLRAVTPWPDPSGNSLPDPKRPRVKPATGCNGY